MTPDFEMPSYRELDAIHRRAAALRAQVFRDGLQAVSRGIARLPRTISTFFHNAART